jgi:leucyl aminopeptidase (aminopeptidase T)
MVCEPLLPPESLARYADAIVRASLGIGKGDTLVVQGQPEHRELFVAVAESAYRAGAQFVDVVTADPLVMRAKLLHGSDDAIGALSPWSRRRLREVAGTRGALAGSPARERPATSTASHPSASRPTIRGWRNRRRSCAARS